MSTRGSGGGEFALKVQLLPTAADRVLVLGHVAGLRNSDGWFGPREVNVLGEALRLPRLGNVSETLSRLESRSLVRRRGSGGWSLTPLGRQTALELVGGIAVDRVLAEDVSSLGAELGQGRWPLIPPEFAPQQWVDPVHAMLDEFPFDANVFCMTRYSSDDDPVGQLVSTLRSSFEEHGLTLHLASDRRIVDDLWSNVAAYMWACKYGVALFEKRVGTLNQNLLIEVGAMLATGRRCLLLKEPDVDMPTDFVGQIYDEADFTDQAAARQVVRRWARDDLRLGAAFGKGDT